MGEVHKVEMVRQLQVLGEIDEVYGKLMVLRNEAKAKTRAAKVAGNKEEYDYYDGCVTAYIDSLNLVSGLHACIQKMGGERDEQTPAPS